MGKNVLITGIGDKRETYIALFTFEYKDADYIVYSNPTGIETELQCDFICWNIWQGVHFSYTEVKDEIYDIADNIIDNNHRDPESYPMNGEHYSVCSSVKDDRCLYQFENELKLWMFSTAAFIAPVILKFILTVMLALSYSYAYISGSGISWASSLFPMLTRKQLVIPLIVIEIIGALFAFKRHKSELGFISLLINTLLPLNIITMLAVMKTNPGIGFVILFILIASSTISLFPVLRETSQEKKVSKKRNRCRAALKYLRIPVLTSVFACMIAVNMFHISGYTYKSTPIEGTEQNTIKDNYYTACGNINENVWSKLTAKEKVDTLQAICDYKCANVLGCETATVQTGYLRSFCILGEYNDTTNTITLDLDHLNEDSVEEVLITLLHESDTFGSTRWLICITI